MHRVAWAENYMCLWSSVRHQESLDRVRYPPDPLDEGESLGVSTCSSAAAREQIFALWGATAIRVNGRGKWPSIVFGPDDSMACDIASE